MRITGTHQIFARNGSPRASGSPAQCGRGVDCANSCSFGVELTVVRGAISKQAWKLKEEAVFVKQFSPVCVCLCVCGRVCVYLCVCVLVVQSLRTEPTAYGNVVVVEEEAVG